jgi:hypothetical protein
MGTDRLRAEIPGAREDVAIEGVSMALAQRSEIAELIAREGVRLGMLLAMLREKGLSSVGRV